MEQQIAKIKSILTEDFESELFLASLDSLNDDGNKLRFNNFAYSIRELSRHFLHRLAPNENVQACTWYTKETENGLPTRAQRIKYAVQGGITDDLLKGYGIDIAHFLKSVKAIKQSIDVLSKYTHINPDVFNLEDIQIEKLSTSVLSDYGNFVVSMDSCRSLLMALLEGKIEEAAIGAVVRASFENIDSIAPHYSLEEAYMDSYKVVEINEDQITVAVEGEINVILSWGSCSDRINGDGHDVEDTFPFSTMVRYWINEDFPDEEPEVDEPGVDTSKWDINPDDEF